MSILVQLFKGTQNHTKNVKLHHHHKTADYNEPHIETDKLITCEPCIRTFFKLL